MTPSDAFDEGYGKGQIGAHLDAVAIKEAKTTVGLAKLAGQRLSIVKRQNPKDWWIMSSNAKFDEGFFEGFLNRAEAIRAAGESRGGA